MSETTTTISYAQSDSASDPIPPPEPIPARFQWVWAPAIFGLLTLAMFYDLLFSPSARVISSQATDLAMQFVPWRDFGFSQLREGHLPLWNPHIYSGAPYFAGFQAALLYPPNWMHLFMPLGLAINWIVAIHVFFAGYFTYLWCRGRYIGIGGSIIAGIMFMFSGPYFLHLYAGHLPHLAVMIWAPLMILSIDKLAETGNWKWCLLGIVATSMHILAGHPQYVYYTGLALSVYMLLLLSTTKYGTRLIAGFAIIYVASILVTAVQLLSGAQAATELVRSGGLAYDIASTFSLPPENFITLFVPTFFRNLTNGYWGAGYLWELSLFVSIAGLTLAAYGAIRNRFKANWLIFAMLFVTVVLALGRHTWLYWPMYKYLPVYGSFRGSVKFAYLAVLFVSLLAAIGFDTLRARSVPIVFTGAIAAVAVLLTLLAGGILYSSSSNGPTGLWGDFVRSVINGAILGHEWFDNINPANNPAFFKPIGHDAAMMCLVAAGTLIGIAVLFACASLHRSIPYLLILVVSIEMFVFARWTRETMVPNYSSAAIPQPWRAPLASMEKGQRILALSPDFINLGMSLGYDNIVGYDPGVFRRYAEMFFAAQNIDPSTADQYLLRAQKLDDLLTAPMRRFMELYRCGLLFYNPENPPADLHNSPLPVAFTVSNFVQLNERNDILKYVLGTPAFDPSKTVVLESAPGVNLSQGASPPGDVKVLNQANDSLEIQATMERPGILVVTNNFSTGWRVKPIEAGQASYSIIPANYAQIGIPLEKGNHHFILEYSPLAFRLGCWVSAISLLALVGTSILLMRRRS